VRQNQTKWFVKIFYFILCFLGSGKMIDAACPIQMKNKLPRSVKLDSFQMLQYYLRLYCGVTIVYSNDALETLRIALFAIFEIPIVVFHLRSTSKFVLIIKEIIFKAQQCRALAFKCKFHSHKIEFALQKKIWNLFQNSRTTWQLFLDDYNMAKNLIANDKLFRYFMKDALTTKISFMELKQMVYEKCVGQTMIPVLTRLKDGALSQTIAKNTQMIAHKACLHAEFAGLCAQRALAVLKVFLN
jgi:hypothetical protein